MKTTTFSDGITIGEVPLSWLRVNHGYQRWLNENRSKQIALAFDTQVRGIPRVLQVKRNICDLIDGQTRIAAEKQQYPDFIDPGTGVERTVTCQILPPGTNAAEAFVKCNSNVKGVTGDEKFKAMLYNGAPREVDIVSNLKGIGLELTFGSGAAKITANCIKHSAAFYKMHVIVGSERFPVAMQMMNLYQYDDGTYETAALTAAFIHGITSLLSSTGYTDSEIIVGLDNGPYASKIVDRGRARAEGVRWDLEESMLWSLNKAIKEGMRKIK